MQKSAAGKFHRDLPGAWLHFRDRRSAPRKNVDVLQSLPAGATIAAVDFTEIGMFRWRLYDKLSLIARPRVAA
jgi:hypothetical protein